MQPINTRLVLGLSICIFGTGCYRPTSESSISATIIVDPAARSKCVKLKVEWNGGAQVTSGVARSDSVVLVVSRTAEMSDTVRLQALGFESCDASEEIEWGPSLATEVPTIGLKEVELELGPVDRDGDGLLSSEDCDDRNSAIPASAEVCTDNRDYDCDGTVGCADSECLGAICSASGGKCQGGVCREEVETLCGDSIDNDGDGQFDCADSDCTDGLCNDGKTCTLGDRCVGGACVGTVQCESPPGQCYGAVGACGASGECEYAVTPGAACDDANECSSGDQCLPDAGCLAQPIHGAACSSNTGVCESGACVAFTSFPFQPTNFNAGAAAAYVNPALTIDCATVLDTSSTSQNMCGTAVRGLLVTQPGGPTALLVPVRDLTVTQLGSLRAIGPHPLILAVYGNATIDGALDVSSPTSGTGATITRSGGAGADVQCGASAGGQSSHFVTTFSPAAKMWGGGGGGGFGAPGGRGGQVYYCSGTCTPAIPGDGGVPKATESLGPLLGGCAGGSGGTIDGIHGLGGRGGGALELSVAGQLQVNQLVHAGGGGGVGGDFKVEPSLWEVTGGGGGGAGGGILLEAQLLVLGPNARITAHGGGGGQGAITYSNIRFHGANGENGRSDAQAAQGAGGTIGGGGSGGTFADGSFGKAGDASDGRAGGGGGGATGRIRINANANCTKAAGALISPAPTFGSKVCQ